MYEVLVSGRASKDLAGLDRLMIPRVEERLLSLKENPRPVGAIKLTGSEAYRFRVGDYRIVYDIDDDKKKIFVTRIRHRKDVYR